jgi:hypothetical protein
MAVIDLDRDPPEDPSLAHAYWCEMDYFLIHAATGDHPDCRCPDGQGHNDPALYPEDA